MRVHQNVGQVTFVTCDMVLGGEGTASQLIQILDRLDPDTLAVDLTVEDLGRIGSSEMEDPFLKAHLEAVEEHAAEDPLEPYDRLLSWASEREMDVHPLGSRSSVGLVKARRIKRTATGTDAQGPEARAKAALDALLDDAQVGPLAKRRRRSLSERLTSLLRQEPPRTVAAFTYPWGEMISADVRRTLGLRRIEGEKRVGGWPD